MTRGDRIPPLRQPSDDLRQWQRTGLAGGRGPPRQHLVLDFPVLEPEIPVRLAPGDRVAKRLKALDRDPDARYQTAQELAEDLRAYLKAERIVVAQSALSGLMKRVLGERIEQRRKAVRAALKALGSGQAAPADLLSGDLAFTPTGKDRITVSGVSSVSQVTGSNLSGLSNITSPSTVGRPSSSFSGLRKDVSQPQPSGLSVGSILGYAVGALGLLIALFVLLFMRH